MLILSDETTVAINKSQLSTFIRYVNHKGEPQDGFFFFSYVSADRSVEALFNHVVCTIKEFSFRAKLVRHMMVQLSLGPHIWPAETSSRNVSTHSLLSHIKI